LQFQNGYYDILWGRDENLLSGISMGVKAAIGSTYNYIAPLYLNLIDAFNMGDLQKARELQIVSIELIKLLIKYGGIPTGKVYMQLVGLDCGTCRLPLQNLTSQRQKQFIEELSLIDFDLYKMK
jgi:N-acetylneuraminate lyase